MLAESLEDLLDRRLHALTRREPGFDQVLSAVAGLLVAGAEAPSVSAEDLGAAYRAHLRSEHRALEEVGRG